MPTSKKKKEIINIKRLAAMAGVTRAWIHFLMSSSDRVTGERRLKDYQPTYYDSDTGHVYWDLKTAQELAEKIKSQRSLPSRIKRSFKR
jgi:hypothetical protein